MKALLGLVLLVSLAGATADSLNCRLIGHCVMPGYCQGVDVLDTIACVSTDSGMYVVNVSDPANPVIIGRFVRSDIALAMGAMVMEGNYVYAVSSYGLRVLSLSDPTNPVQVGVCHLPCGSLDVTKVGNLAYVADWTSGLRIVDVSDPVHPVEVGHCATDSARVVVVRGNYAYVADQGETKIIDISDPTDPFQVGTFPTTLYAEGVDVFGSQYMIIADGATMRLVDVSDPANLVEVSYYDQWGYAYNVEVTGDLAYVASHGGVHVIDVADPVNPMEVGYYYDTGSVHVSYVARKAGRYLYIPDYYHGLEIVEFYGEGVGVEEGRRPPAYSSQLAATIVRGVLFLADDLRPKTGDRAALLDAAGRRVMELHPGPNDVRHLSPGVYFISSPKSAERIVLTR